MPSYSFWRITRAVLIAGAIGLGVGLVTAFLLPMATGSAVALLSQTPLASVVNLPVLFGGAESFAANAGMVSAFFGVSGALSGAVAEFQGQWRQRHPKAATISDASLRAGAATIVHMQPVLHPGSPAPLLVAGAPSASVMASEPLGERVPELRALKASELLGTLGAEPAQARLH